MTHANGPLSPWLWVGCLASSARDSVVVVFPASAAGTVAMSTTGCSSCTPRTVI